MMVVSFYFYLPLTIMISRIYLARPQPRYPVKASMTPYGDSNK